MSQPTELRPSPAHPAHPAPDPIGVDRAMLDRAVGGWRGMIDSGVPTVVYGYFALLMVTPLLQKVWPELPGFNMLSAGLVIGLMIFGLSRDLTCV